MNKIKEFAQRNYGKMVVALGMVVYGASAHADVATTSDVSATFSALLNSLVLAIINVIVKFFTDNLPIIVILGVCVSLVWYFVRKARGASRGK